MSNYIGSSEEALDFMRSIHARDRLIVELAECLLDVLDADGDLDVMDFNRYRAAVEQVKGMQS